MQMQMHWDSAIWNVVWFASEAGEGRRIYGTSFGLVSKLTSRGQKSVGHDLILTINVTPDSKV